MAIYASDDFAGISNGTSISSRTLNNALGGSGTRTWVSNGVASLQGDGAGRIKGATPSAFINLLTDGQGYKVRVEFDPSGGTSSIAVAARKVAATGVTTWVVAVLSTSHTVFALREGSGTSNTPSPEGTVLATQTISAPATPFAVEVTANGLVFTAKIIRLSDSVELASVSYTYSSGAPTGAYATFGFANNGSTGTFDNFTIDDLASGGAPPAGTVTITSVTPGETTASVVYSYDDTDQTGFEYRLDGGTPASIGASPATITGLTASTTYDLEIRAINDDGDGAWSDVETFTTTSPDTEDPEWPPSTTLDLVSKTDTTITVEASADATDNVAVTGYEWSTDDGATYPFTSLTSTFPFSALTAFTAYPLRVRAYDAAGNRSTHLALSVTTYRPGATGQDILDNTGPVGDNPAGLLYDRVETGEEGDWFWVEVTEEPATGTLEVFADGTYTFTGPDATTAEVQFGKNDDAVGSPVTVYLYTQTIPDVPPDPVPGEASTVMPIGMIGFLTNR